VLDRDRLRRLIEVGRSLVSNLELETVLHRLVEVGRELTGARYGALGILDERRQELERFITSGIDDDLRATIGELPRGRGVLGELIRDPRPLRLANVGDHPHSYGFPAGHPPMRTFLGVPVKVRGEAFGNLYLTEKDGGPFDEADEEAVTILADFAAIAIENARLYSYAEARGDELQRAVRRLEATTEIARTLEGDLELAHTLELIAKRGRALVDTRWLVILLRGEHGLEVAAAAGSLPSDSVGTQLEIDARDPLGEALRAGGRRRALETPEPLARALGDSSIAGGNALFVPLVFRNEPLGLLVAAGESPSGRPLAAEDGRLLETIAAAGANAVQTAKSVAAERLRHSIEASERERRRWARELHDETLQALGGLQLLLSSALRGPHERLPEAVRRAADEIGGQIAGLRALIAELRPAALDELGLVPAIETLAQRTAASEDITVETNVELELEAAGRLEPEVESTLYRLTQEALTNVVKHARASRVEMTLVRADKAIELTVSDDGSGFDVKASTGGFGLVGMRERVTLAGGRLEIASTRGQGTTLRATLPAAGPASANAFAPGHTGAEGRLGPGPRAGKAPGRA